MVWCNCGNEDRKHFSKDTQHGVTLQLGISNRIPIVSVTGTYYAMGIIVYAHAYYKVLAKEFDFHQVHIVLNYDIEILYILYTNPIILYM